MRHFLRSILFSTLGAFFLAGLGGLVHAKAIEGVVNINTATVFELGLLPGIGKTKAERIVQLRQAKPFASVDDLKAIGLNGKRLELLRPHVVLSGPTTAKAVKETATKLPAPNPPPAPKL